MSNRFQDNDENAEKRKKDHIALTEKSQLSASKLDNRFYYEPMLSGHPTHPAIVSKKFLDAEFKLPIWVSSMTGGTAKAKTINQNLARACKDFGMGMGLGSCRALLTSSERLADFDVRKLIGDQPLYANLGVAQLEQLIKNNTLHLAEELVQKLQADGLIIHVNPLQEWMQSEGDRYTMSPIEIVKYVLDSKIEKVIVKEVGQGMGPKSLFALLNLPITALDFGAAGGTNFALLEVLRTKTGTHPHMPLTQVGHSADEMLEFCNDIANSNLLACNQLIISGGIQDFLHGYSLINNSILPAIYGQASGFLQHAQGSYDTLAAYVEEQKQGLLMANTFLNLRS